jgi:hypothetical protein
MPLSASGPLQTEVFLEVQSTVALMPAPPHYRDTAFSACEPTVCLSFVADAVPLFDGSATLYRLHGTDC